MSDNEDIVDEVYQKFKKLKTEVINAWLKKDLDLAYKLIYSNKSKPQNWNPTLRDLSKIFHDEFNNKTKQALNIHLTLEERDKIVKNLTVKEKKGVKLL